MILIKERIKIKPVDSGINSGIKSKKVAFCSDHLIVT